MTVISIEACILASLLLAIGGGTGQDDPGHPPDTGGKVGLSSSGDSLRYGRHGSMHVHPGRRDTVVSILLEVSESLRSAGCLLYVVSHDPDEADLIWVTEVWESRASHQASLELTDVRQAIARARPMLTGEFTGQEFDVAGGLGLPDGSR